MDSSFLFVGLGGALGAMARVGLSRILPSFLLSLPFKILCINILGCFAIGVLTEIMAHYWSASLNMRHFLVQGFLGGFTTFSAFALEFGLLYEKGTHWTAITYVLLSVLLSLTFFFFGLRVIRLFS
ncbi:MAG: putative fluoride ion transporter CrcB [Chlamydiae bacterium]|nr:putative fluoride ion transporter CrcB [Chlamydiota bacterium]